AGCRLKPQATTDHWAVSAVPPWPLPWSWGCAYAIDRGADQTCRAISVDAIQRRNPRKVRTRHAKMRQPGPRPRRKPTTTLRPPSTQTCRGYADFAPAQTNELQPCRATPETPILLMTIPEQSTTPKRTYRLHQRGACVPTPTLDS